MPLNPDYVGKVYSDKPRVITAEEGIAYAKATLDPTPSLLSGEAIPPMFAVNPIIDVAMQVCRDPGLGVDLLRLVHGEERMHFGRLLRPGEMVRPESTITGIQNKASGELLQLTHRVWVGDEVVAESQSAYFIRSPKPKTSSPKVLNKPKTPARPEHNGAPIFNVEVRIPDEQPSAYAKASRDFNPIHTDPIVAQKAGLPGCILHGLCTMAMAAHQVVTHVASGDPGRLASIGVRFSNLVLPGDSLHYRGFKLSSDQGEQVVGLQTLNQRDQFVLTKARAEVRN